MGSELVDLFHFLMLHMLTIKLTFIKIPDDNLLIVRPSIQVISFYFHVQYPAVMSFENMFRPYDIIRFFNYLNYFRWFRLFTFFGLFFPFFLLLPLGFFDGLQALFFHQGEVRRVKGFLKVDHVQIIFNCCNQIFICAINVCGYILEFQTIEQRIILHVDYNQNIEIANCKDPLLVIKCESLYASRQRVYSIKFLFLKIPNSNFTFHARGIKKILPLFDDQF